MPIALDQMQAKTSTYQDNGPLNALVHVLVHKMAAVPPTVLVGGAHVPNPAITELLAAFQAEWGVYLGWNDLIEVLNNTTDPMHREMLLGPVLRHLLPEDITMQGKDAVEGVPLEAVSGLAKRFGIRVESYSGYSGILEAIKEGLLKKHSGIKKEALDLMAAREFRRALGPEICNKFLRDGLHDNENLARQRTMDELGKILNGNAPTYPKTQKDSLPEGDNKLAVNDANYLATLSLLRVPEGYRFAMTEQGRDTVNIIDTVTHNRSEGYKTICHYATTAPILREQLQIAVAKAAVADNVTDAARPAAIKNAFKDTVSSTFTSYQAGSSKGAKTGPGARKGVGVVEGVLDNVSTFFGTNDKSESGVFGPLQGIMGLFQALLGPFMQMITGFQETLLEFNKKPGDPLSNKEINAHKDESLRAAAKDFCIRVEALGVSYSSKLLNEAWRADPDATGVWVDLIQKLVNDDQLGAADECLHAQEAKLLKRVEAILKESKEPAKRKIQETLEEYQNAIGPLRSGAMTEALKQESLGARLGLFIEFDTQVDKLSSIHAKAGDTAAQKTRLEAEKKVLDAQKTVVHAEAAHSPLEATLNSRLEAVQKQLEAFTTQNQIAIEAEETALAQFHLQKEETQEQGTNLGNRFWQAASSLIFSSGPDASAQQPRTNLGRCAALAQRAEVAFRHHAAARPS